MWFTDRSCMFHGSRALLERAMEKNSPRQEPPDEEKEEEEKEEEEGEEEKEGEKVKRKPGASEHHFRVDVENISVSSCMYIHVVGASLGMPHTTSR